MPLDPNISLQVNQPPPAGSAVPNILNQLMPLMQMGNLGSQIQSRNLANYQAQRTIAGQNAFAEAASQAVGPDGNLDNDKLLTIMAMNPLIAQTMPVQAQALRQAQLAQYQMQRERQTMAQDGLKTIWQTIATGVKQPDQLPAILKTQFSTLSPITKEAIGPAVSDYLSGALFSDLPGTAGSPEQIAEIRRRAQPLVAGLPKDQFEAINGRPEARDTGNGIMPGMTDIWTGQWTPSGQFARKGLPPQITGAENVFSPGYTPSNQFGPSNSLMSGGTQQPFLNQSGPTNSLNNPPSAGIPPTAPGAGAGNYTPPTPASATPPSLPTSPSDKSWLTEEPFSVEDDRKMVSGRNMGGQPILRNATQRLPEKGPGSLEQFQQSFDNSQTTLQILDGMKHDYHILGASGFLSPGAGGAAREALANMAQTTLNVMGATKIAADWGVDPSKVATAQDLMKDSRRLVLSYLTSVLGVQREAAMTIQNMMQAVPGIENTPFGSQLVMSGVEALARRSVDEFGYMDKYSNVNGFYSRKGIADFNAKYTPESYLEKTWGQVGMGPNGWLSRTAILNAAKQGWITQDQALKMSKDFKGAQ